MPAAGVATGSPRRQTDHSENNATHGESRCIHQPLRSKGLDSNAGNGLVHVMCLPWKRGQGTRQRRQRPRADSFCFSFFWRAAETRCSCCRGACLLVCAGGTSRAPATPPTTGGGPRRLAAVLSVGAAGHSLVLSDFGRKGPRSAAEWSAPWKRSFCASGQDRNGTVSCRCRLRLAPSALPLRSPLAGRRVPRLSRDSADSGGQGYESI